jgi:hypothetical protein
MPGTQARAGHGWVCSGGSMFRAAVRQGGLRPRDHVTLLVSKLSTQWCLSLVVTALCFLT